MAGTVLVLVCITITSPCQILKADWWIPTPGVHLAQLWRAVVSLSSTQLNSTQLSGNSSRPSVQIISELTMQFLGIHHLSAMLHADSSPLLHLHTYHGDTVDFLGRMSQPSAHH